MNNDRGTWKSKITFVLAAAGSAVGLGNLWRFSYEAGNNGGGLFVIIYLLAILLIGLPVLLAELSMGRFSQQDVVGAFQTIRPKTPFVGIGYLGLISAVMILAFYSVIAGQTVGYVVKSITGDIGRLGDASVTEGPLREIRQIYADMKSDPERRQHSALQIEDFFDRYQLDADPEGEELLQEAKGGDADQDPADREVLIKKIEMKLLVARSSGVFERFEKNKYLQIILLLFFLFITVFIVSRGISGGIEKFTRVFMPVLLIILVIMILRALTLPNAFSGVGFYLAPKLDQLTPKLVVSAIGQAFFSLSLGMGTMITYGSYVNKRERLPNSAGLIAGFDTGIAILAGFIVFPVIFYLGMNPDQGAGGIFVVLPILFAKIPLGQFFAVMFFVLLGIAALTSTVSLLEVPVAFLVDQKGWKRRKAAYLIGGLTLLFGVPCALFSFFFSLWNTVWGGFALTIGGLFISIFVGWVWKPEAALREIRQGSERFRLGAVWRFLIRYIIPIFLIVILASSIIELI